MFFKQTDRNRKILIQFHSRAIYVSFRDVYGKPPSFHPTIRIFAVATTIHIFAVQNGTRFDVVKRLLEENLESIKRKRKKQKNFLFLNTLV